MRSGIGDAAHPLGHAVEELEVVELLEGVLVGRRLRCTSWTSATTGTEAFSASARPGTSSVAAGPFWAVTTADLVADPGIGVGHRGAGVLRPVADLTDAECRSDEEQGGGNALAEDHLDAVALELRRPWHERRNYSLSY